MMNSLFNGFSSPSAHIDVLSATPDNVDAKRVLTEEIKRRGRASVSTKRYNDADALYSKAIDVLLSIVSGDGQDDLSNKDIAVMYSNRSFVRMQMGKIDEALEDADSAVNHDPFYTKAYWRQGQALTARGRPSEALVSFEKALSLEPQNKALMKEVRLANERKTQEEHSGAQTLKGADGMESGIDIEKSTKAVSAPSKTTELNVKSSTESNILEHQDESLFSKSDHIRGYKIRSDGKKTSYFDREISEKEKLLIGNIEPKKIDPFFAKQTAIDDPKLPSALVGVSAWNKAGTWEERDVSSWAKETLKAALLSAEYVLPDGSSLSGARATISKVPKLDGHASYASVRGKKRYIYEFAVTVDWILLFGNNNSETCRGSMTFPDIDGTVELETGYDMVDYCVDESSIAGTGAVLDRFVRNGGLRNSINNVIDSWVRLFHSTY